uniref:Uncharacterized protein n=1 Tax=Aegilops tauschii subsp. strangulata TaxID=200361 RepID=A0A453MII1_AEGTS
LRHVLPSPVASSPVGPLSARDHHQEASPAAINDGGRDASRRLNSQERINPYDEAH